MFTSVLALSKKTYEASGLRSAATPYSADYKFQRPHPPDSDGNPVVHSLLVTIGNHAVLSTQPYNGPCPKDHLLICGETPIGDEMVGEFSQSEGFSGT